MEPLLVADSELDDGRNAARSQKVFSKKTRRAISSLTDQWRAPRMGWGQIQQNSGAAPNFCILSAS
jgi:hypothetical protein